MFGSTLTRPDFEALLAVLTLIFNYISYNRLYQTGRRLIGRGLVYRLVPVYS